MNSKLRKAARIWRDDGVLQLTVKSVKHLSAKVGQLYARTARPLLPSAGYVHTNSVRTHRQKVGDEHLPSHWPIRTADKPEGKKGLTKPHREFTSDGDTVLIVGGGAGISPTVAGREVGDDGSVVVYEAAAEYVTVTLDVLGMNDVEDIVDVRHAIVGPGVDVMGDGSKATPVNVSELPEGNVLELDCEGAEVQILKELEARPRVVTVEIHPEKIDGKSADVLNLLSDRGYEIRRRFTPWGYELTHEELLTKLSGAGGNPEPETDRRAIVVGVAD